MKMEENRTTENSVEFPEIDLKIEDKTKKKKGVIELQLLKNIR